MSAQPDDDTDGLTPFERSRLGPVGLAVLDGRELPPRGSVSRLPPAALTVLHAHAACGSVDPETSAAMVDAETQAHARRLASRLCVFVARWPTAA